VQRDAIVLLRGVGVSPSVGYGEVTVVRDPSQMKGVRPGAIVALRRITPDMAVFLKSTSGIIADEGGITSHAANILREFRVPCIVGTEYATEVLKDRDVVTVDGWRGIVFDDVVEIIPTFEPVEEKIPTSMDVLASLEVPETALSVQRYADGVSSMRNDFLLLSEGAHPSALLREDRERLERLIMYGVELVARTFRPKQVWYKTLDAPTDEFRLLEGGEDEPIERNPMLGWRGISRELDEGELLEAEYSAILRLVRKGNRNIGIKVPFARTPKQYREAKEVASDLGLEPHVDVKFGVSVETPATAIRIEDFLEERADFVSVGINDLVMCALAVDRTNERISRLFDLSHPAIFRLLSKIVSGCRKHGTYACVAGRVAQDRALLEKVISLGYDAVGTSPPYIPLVRRTIAMHEMRERMGAFVKEE